MKFTFNIWFLQYMAFKTLHLITYTYFVLLTGFVTKSDIEQASLSLIRDMTSEFSSWGCRRASESPESSKLGCDNPIILSIWVRTGSDPNMWWWLFGDSKTANNIQTLWMFFFMDNMLHSIWVTVKSLVMYTLFPDKIWLKVGCIIHKNKTLPHFLERVSGDHIGKTADITCNAGWIDKHWTCSTKNIKFFIYVCRKLTLP